MLPTIRTIAFALVLALSTAAGAAFNPMTACRVIDTRDADPPELAGQSTRDFTLRGLCGIPPDATVSSGSAAGAGLSLKSRGMCTRPFPNGPGPRCSSTTP